MQQSNRILQKEQHDLYTIERKLEKVLPVIKEALNSLKVEELHLKSQVLQRTALSQSLSQLTPPLMDTSSPDTKYTAQINEQEIDLGICKKLEELEEESDDSD